jgi:hypothetical protein
MQASVASDGVEISFDGVKNVEFFFLFPNGIE